MTEQSIDLGSLLQAITQNLSDHREDLNKADTYNGNHGDNIVDAFRTAEQAVRKSKGKSASSKMQAASRALIKKQSGSAQMYGKGFGQAAKDFKGKEVTPDTMGTLIEALMGGGAPKMAPAPTRRTQTQAQPQPSAGGDLLSTLLGSLVGQEAPAPQPQRRQEQPQGGDLLGSLIGGLLGGKSQQRAPQRQEPAGGDLLSTLLGSLTGQDSQPSRQQQSQGGGLMETLLGGLLGGGASSNLQNDVSPEDLIGSLLGSSPSQRQQISEQSGISTGDLLSGALRYYAAKRSGSSNLESIMSALSKSSPMGRSQDRTESGALIIQSILGMLGNR